MDYMFTKSIFYRLRGKNYQDRIIISRHRESYVIGLVGCVEISTVS